MRIDPEGGEGERLDVDDMGPSSCLRPNADLGLEPHADAELWEAGEGGVGRDVAPIVEP